MQRGESEIRIKDQENRKKARNGGVFVRGSHSPIISGRVIWLRDVQWKQMEILRHSFMELEGWDRLRIDRKSALTLPTTNTFIFDVHRTTSFIFGMALSPRPSRAFSWHAHISSSDSASHSATSPPLYCKRPSRPSPHPMTDGRQQPFYYIHIIWHIRTHTF